MSSDLDHAEQIRIERHHDAWRGCFDLMASKCEIHIRDTDQDGARRLIEQSWREAKRIEIKYSRYIKGNTLSNINQSAGIVTLLDTETTALVHYADMLHTLSDGLFDLTAGSLRYLWRFGSDMGKCRDNDYPSEEKIQAALANVGWHQVSWRVPELTLRKGMELDFGGIGKEYAVDHISQLIAEEFDGQFLVNFGGDCFCRGTSEKPWYIAVESPKQSFVNGKYTRALSSYTIISGAVATSGTTKRFIDVDGKRFGHILNPKTGKPVEGAPLSITVAGDTCMSAGGISTLAMLQGHDAENFLMSQNVDYYLIS